MVHGIEPENRHLLLLIGLRVGCTDEKVDSNISQKALTEGSTLHLRSIVSWHSYFNQHPSPYIKHTIICLFLIPGGDL